MDRAQLLTLTAPEMTVLVGGLRVRRQTDGISSEVKFAPDSDSTPRPLSQKWLPSAESPGADLSIK